MGGEEIRKNSENILVFQNHDGVWIADSSFEKSLRIFRAPWWNDFQSRDATIPTWIILRMLCRNARCKAVGPTEGDVTGLDSTRHVMRLGSGIYNLINCLHCKVEGHELALQNDEHWQSIWKYLYEVVGTCHWV